jgi:hypothetical protein
MNYRCTADLYSIYFKGLLKFSKDGIYKCIRKDVYINNQGMADFIVHEGWQKYFIPLENNDQYEAEIENVNIDELLELLKPYKIQ